MSDPTGDTLNLGCGRFPKPGHINVDRSPTALADVVHDLNVFPYPFEANRFRVIVAEHVLEHLEDPCAVMRELHRIARPGSEVRIRVPHFSRGFTHPEHKRGFDFNFPLYFDPSFPGGYAGVAFRLKKRRMRWFGQPWLKRQVLPRPVFAVMRAAGVLLDALANACPAFCSRCWCYLAGGFEEIEFVFEKPL